MSSAREAMQQQATNTAMGKARPLAATQQVAQHVQRFDTEERHRGRGDAKGYPVRYTHS